MHVIRSLTSTLPFRGTYHLDFSPSSTAGDKARAGIIALRSKQALTGVPVYGTMLSVGWSIVFRCESGTVLMSKFVCPKLRVT